MGYGGGGSCDRRLWGLLLAIALVAAIALSRPMPVPAESPAADAPAVGNPLAPGMMVLLENEMVAGLKTRGASGAFARFASYAGAKLSSTSGVHTGSEVTGLCRLRWYDHLLRNPMTAPGEAEEFTRILHAALAGDHAGLEQALSIARARTDCDPPHERGTASAIATPEEALRAVSQALIEARAAHAAAVAPLARSEIQQLARDLYPVFTSENRVGHTLSRRSTAQTLCGLLKKMDRGALYAGVEALAPLTNRDLLKQLGSLAEEGDVSVPGVAGTVVRQVATPAGNIVIGGRGKNTYQLDQMPEVSAVIDLGGDDEYQDGAVSLARPVLLVIDLAGNDAYKGSKPGIQGSAILGISMLLDVEGDDAYRAQDVAQASALGGAGILIDYAGNDSYLGLRRVQGQAIGGVGMLIDRNGRDAYKAALWAQGVGGPLGFAVLDDLEGNDHYYGGGLYINSYKDDPDNPTPGYEGWAQGMGEGIRGVANGGIGVILDGGGDDLYEFDYLSHGGGYWLGVGLARDFGGNDRRVGATLKAYSGGNRTETRYQRFGRGFGCHYALGFCFDDEGDDTYSGTIMGSGFAWDCSVGVLCDFGGNDRYDATGSTTKGVGAQAGFGILYDYNGDDEYLGGGQGYASASINPEYHSLPSCGGNFAFLVDYGGTDKYGCGAKNNTYNRRGGAGGFLIDRPSRKSEDDQRQPSGGKEATVAGMPSPEITSE